MEENVRSLVIRGNRRLGYVAFFDDDKKLHREGKKRSSVLGSFILENVHLPYPYKGMKIIYQFDAWPAFQNLCDLREDFFVCTGQGTLL